MNTLCCCSFCGQCCDDLDVVDAEKLDVSCEEKIGKKIMHRISRVQKPVICRYHLESNFTGRTSYEAFFNDHDYARFDNPENITLKRKTMTICMMCQKNVHEKSITSHALQHAGSIDIRKYLCEQHKLKRAKQASNQFTPEFCRDCYFLLSQANALRNKRFINICFPLYQCDISIHQTVYGVSHNLIVNLPKYYEEKKAAELSGPKEKTRENVVQVQNVVRVIKEEENNVVVAEEPLEFIKTEIKEEVMEIDIKEEVDDDEYMEVVDNDKNDVDFELPSDPGEEYQDLDDDEFDDPDLEDEEEAEAIKKRQMNSEVVQNFFELNPHPTCRQISEFCKKNTIRYYVFEKSWRAVMRRTKCKADDSCALIQSFNELAKKTPFPPISKEKIKLCQEVFEKYFEEGSIFEKIDAYQYAEEFELNPHSILKEWKSFESSRKTRMSAEEKMKKWEEQNEGVHNNSLNTKHVSLRAPAPRRLPKEAVKKLLKEFEIDSVCDPTRVGQLSQQLGLTKSSIQNWFIRQRRSLNGDKRIEQRHTFTEKEKEYLSAKFDENQYPNSAEKNEMAKELGLTPGNVISYFNSKRTELRKRQEWEVVGKEIELLPESKIDELMKAFQNSPNTKYEDRIKIASEIKVSYQLVTLWFEIKTLEKRKRNKCGRHSGRKSKKYSKSDRYSDDSEEEEDDENMSEDEDPLWKSLILLVSNATQKVEPKRESLRKVERKRFQNFDEDEDETSDEDWAVKNLSMFLEETGETTQS